MIWIVYRRMDSYSNTIPATREQRKGTTVNKDSEQRTKKKQHANNMNH